MLPRKAPIHEHLFALDEFVAFAGVFAGLLPFCIGTDLSQSTDRHPLGSLALTSLTNHPRFGYYGIATFVRMSAALGHPSSMRAKPVGLG